MRRLQYGRCGELREKALLAPDCCLPSLLYDDYALEGQLVAQVRFKIQQQLPSDFILYCPLQVTHNLRFQHVIVIILGMRCLTQYDVFICAEASFNAILILFFHICISIGLAICLRLI
jgi:hypothetical protein